MGESDIFESMTLSNGDTQYEAFSSNERGSDGDRTGGGIIVTLPNGPALTLMCDAGSVWPLDPIEGIGRIGDLFYGDDRELFLKCLRDLPDETAPSQCLGSYRDVQISNGICDEGLDQTQCWETESAQWAQLVETCYVQTLAAIRNNGDAQLALDLKASQDSWSQSHALDCKVKGVLIFAPDGGTALCNAEYAADRIVFLNSVMSLSAFDG